MEFKPSIVKTFCKADNFLYDKIKTDYARYKKKEKKTYWFKIEHNLSFYHHIYLITC